MLVFPQLLSGAVSHFPIRKRVITRTVRNLLSDGQAVKYPDRGLRTVEWQLDYHNLTGTETNVLESFFHAAAGRLRSFTFLDPTDNLLRRSGQLTGGAWLVSPLLSLAGDIEDLFRTRTGYRVTNTSAAAQALEQIVPAPGNLTYCFSAYVRGLGSSVRFLIDSAGSPDLSAGGGWRRVSHRFISPGGGSSIRCGIALAPHAVVDICGVQLEAQPGASTYKPTGDRTGVYAEARFVDDQFAWVATAPNRHSCQLRIQSRY